MTLLGSLVDYFPYIISWDDDAEEYVATTPAYPEMYFRGATEKDAFNGLREVLSVIDLDED